MSRISGQRNLLRKPDDEKELQQFVKLIKKVCTYSNRCRFNSCGVSEVNKSRLLDLFNKSGWTAYYDRREEIIFIKKE